MPRPLLALAALPLIAACAADPTVYPSLAPRAIEKLGFEEPAPPPPAPAQPDPTLDVRIATIVGKRTTAAQEFDRAAQVAVTKARAAKGAKVGSDRWIDAQTAIAELDALRGATADAIGALEDLAAQRALALKPAYPPLDRALADARAASQAQTARIDALAGSLPGA